MKIAHILINNAVKKYFKEYFPNPESLKKSENHNPYEKMIQWFSKGNSLDLLLNATDKDFEKNLRNVPGLFDLVKKSHPKASNEEHVLYMEYVLFGLSEYSFLSKVPMDSRLQFRDILSTMLDDSDGDEFDDDDAYNPRRMI